MHAEHLFDGEALHHAFLDHLVAAAAAFFGRLEDHGDRAGEIARLGEIFRRAEQHGGVAVMAAGMHVARRVGSVGLAGRLGDRQRVHVGAQADGRPVAVPAADHADDAGAADAGHDLVAAEFPQLLVDEAGGLEHVEIELRDCDADVASPAGDLVLHFGGAVENGHVFQASCSRAANWDDSGARRITGLCHLGVT